MLIICQSCFNCRNNFLKCKLIEKKSISKILSTVLFIGCTVFVGIRGNKCFEKYLEKPEVVGVSYKFSGKMPFPSFSICTRDNDTYNDFVFEECNLKKVDYITNGPWVGTGNANCTNPKGKKKTYFSKVTKFDLK